MTGLEMLKNARRSGEGPRHRFRKALWGLVAWLFCPIGAYALKARARACGCITCSLMLARRELFAGPLESGTYDTSKPVGPN